jgi:excinuclease ABC subunit C
VYIYKDTDGTILYVGKAKILKHRVRSYFAPPTTLGPKTQKLVERIHSLETIEVFSEIEALLLESRLISKFKPPFNIASKDDKSPYYIHISTEKFPKPVINHTPQKAIAGPFLNGYVAKQILRNLRRIAPFCTAQRNGRKCLYAHMGLCNPCPNDPTTTVSDYRKNIVVLKKLLKGEFKQVRSHMTKQMQDLSKDQKFEEAAKVRNQIQSLDYLLTKPIGPEEFLVNPNLTEDKRQESMDALKTALEEQGLKINSVSRIEMYDIANLSGKSATAAMTVAVEGEVNSKYYRHFKIKTLNEPNDVGMMQEVLTRRLKRTDWPTPDLIVLDGGKAQLSIGPHLNSPIPIIALAKKQEIITVPTLQGFIEIQLERTHPGLKILQNLRDEAHRFSRRLHHNYRGDTIKINGKRT